LAEHERAVELWWADCCPLKTCPIKPESLVVVCESRALELLERGSGGLLLERLDQGCREAPFDESRPENRAETCQLALTLRWEAVRPLSTVLASLVALTLVAAWSWKVLRRMKRRPPSQEA
jgi:hypothetical protein